MNSEAQLKELAELLKRPHWSPADSVTFSQEGKDLVFKMAYHLDEGQDAYDAKTISDYFKRIGLPVVTKEQINDESKPEKAHFGGHWEYREATVTIPANSFNAAKAIENLSAAVKSDALHPLKNPKRDYSEAIEHAVNHGRISPQDLAENVAELVKAARAAFQDPQQQDDFNNALKAAAELGVNVTPRATGKIRK